MTAVVDHGATSIAGGSLSVRELAFLDMQEEKKNNKILMITYYATVKSPKGYAY